MNSLIIVGSLILGWNGTAHTVNDTTKNQLESIGVPCKVEVVNLDLDQIAYAENEQEVILDFDTAQYLPENFDPYIGSINDLEFVDMEASEEVALGFESADYLPEGFDPYIRDLDGVDLAVEDENVDLGFDTAEYLPANFDPYVDDLNSLAYVEEESEVVLGFDTAAYLPTHFDPHVGDLDAIVYEELDYHFMERFHAIETVAEMEIQ